jgi:hypothetical protein
MYYGYVIKRRKQTKPKLFPHKFINFSAGGAILILSAMCCWLKAPNRTADGNEEVITFFSPFMPRTWRYH